MGIKPQTPQTISRVAVQRCDLVNGSAVGDDMVEQEDSDELKKTSSVLSGMCVHIYEHSYLVYFICMLSVMNCL